jgi:hypothetical protein
MGVWLRRGQGLTQPANKVTGTESHVIKICLRQLSNYLLSFACVSGVAQVQDICT